LLRHSDDELKDASDDSSEESSYIIWLISLFEGTQIPEEKLDSDLVSKNSKSEPSSETISFSDSSPSLLEKGSSSIRTKSSPAVTIVSCELT
jgi:hypothetical protein